MTRNPTQTNHPQEPTPNDLDDLADLSGLDHLLSRTSPSIPNATTARLHTFYQAHRRRTKFRRLLPLTAAAGLAAAITLALLPNLRTPRPPLLSHQPPTTPTLKPTPTTPDTPPVTATTRIDTLSRPPTQTERLALLAANPRSRPPAPPPPKPDPEIERLFTTLNSPLLANRLAAAERLGRLADAPTVNRLIALTRSPATSREAALALLASPLPEAKAFLASRQAQPLLALLPSLTATPQPNPKFSPRSQSQPASSTPESL